VILQISDRYYRDPSIIIDADTLITVNDDQGVVIKKRIKRVDTKRETVLRRMRKDLKGKAALRTDTFYFDYEPAGLWGPPQKGKLFLVGICKILWEGGEVRDGWGIIGHYYKGR